MDVPIIHLSKLHVSDRYEIFFGGKRDFFHENSRRFVVCLKNQINMDPNIF